MTNTLICSAFHDQIFLRPFSPSGRKLTQEAGAKFDKQVYDILKLQINY